MTFHLCTFVAKESVRIINVLIVDSALKSLAQEVLDIMRKILGVETYTQLFAKTHKEQYDRKESRKRKDAVEVCIQFNAVSHVRHLLAVHGDFISPFTNGSLVLGY